MSCMSNESRRLAIAAAVIAAMTLSGGDAFAQRAFSGEDAAHVDWAWKNCSVEATGKERSLVEAAAKSTAGDKFQKAYEQAYNALIAKTAEPAALRRVCQSIQEWYGPGGSRIDGLVAAKGASPAEITGKSIGRPAQSKGRP